MIVVDIIQRNENLAIEISKYLIENKYAMHTHIDTNKIYGQDTEIVSIRLFFITKALLYDMIYNEISEKFGLEEMLIYATPISHISKDFGEKLRLNLKAV